MALRNERAAHCQAGIALLLVVWLLALLTVIAGEFMASGRVKATAEHNKLDDLRLLALAQAGYRAAVAALDGDIEAFELDEDEQLLLRYSGLKVGVPAAATDVPLGDGTYSWRVSNEDGLVNINTAKRSELEGLLRKCGMGPGAERDTVIASILDWVDPNRDHRLNGAEEDYYRALDPPYSCKDGFFDVIEELLLVRGVGVTPRLFSGGEVDGERKPGLRDLVSPHAGNSLNRWTAPEEVLDALGLARPVSPEKPTADWQNFVIVATGKLPERSASGDPISRSLRAVIVRKFDVNSNSYSFPLVYWNDTYTPE